jgi:phage shock protein C
LKKRRLYRSKNDVFFGGVASGLAEFFNTESYIIRILFVLAAIFGGWGIIVYIILWIVVPEKDGIEYTDYQDLGKDNQESDAQNSDSANEKKQTEEHSSENKNKRGSIIAGVALILIGFIFIIDNYLPAISIKDLWPVVLIGIGVLIIFNGISETKKRKDEV